MTNEQRIARLAAAIADAPRETRLLPAGSEQRFCTASVRSETTAGKRYAVGHAAVFSTLSRDLGGFKERLQRGAFSRAIAARQDTKFLLNHDANQILARVKNGSLELREDSIGLAFRALLPNTTAGDDLEQLLDDGLVDECSFAFTVGSDGQRWSREIDPETGDMCDVRDLLDIEDLYDCSAVVYPAYPGTDTSLATRALWASGEMPAELRSHLRTRVGVIDEVQLNRRRRLRLREALLTL